MSSCKAPETNALAPAAATGSLPAVHSGGLPANLAPSQFLKNANFKIDVAADAYFSGSANVATSTASVEANLDKLFNELRESGEDTQDELSAESAMSYAMALGVDPEKAGIFALMELLQAPSLGTITRQGFIEGWKTTGAQPTKSGQKDHIQTVIRSMQTDTELFRRVYRYAFVAGKETPEQRAVPLDNALVYWQCFLGADQHQGKPWVTTGGPGAAGGTTDWFALWSDYLKANWTRTVSKDMWNQTLVFALKTLADPTLGFWTPDGAWPSVIDNFVEWVRAKQGTSATPVATMEVDS
ncbi:hypothetical protein RB599_009480 [Gaeumannomyces hyphopodioides]